MNNYPAGSMMGSGIYAEEVQVDFTCGECGHENVNADGTTDDWQTSALAECEKCGHETDVDLPTEDDDSDAAYDAWRDAAYDH